MILRNPGSGYKTLETEASNNAETRVLRETGARLGDRGPRGNAFVRAGTSSQALRRFKLGSITDEWTPDFQAALKAMKRYGLAWAEIRTVGKTYITEASKEELRKMKGLLFRYRIRVSVVDSALFKCALPGTAPVAGEKDAYPYSAQMDLLKRALDRAHFFGTGKIRVFAFWRVADNQSHFDRIAEELRKAAEVAHAGGGRR